MGKRILIIAISALIALLPLATALADGVGDSPVMP